MAKFKKINWDKIDTQMNNAIISDKNEYIPERVQEAMKHFPPWRFYTDSLTCTFPYRVLGVYPPEQDVELNPDYKIQLIVASLLPENTQILHMELYNLDDVLQIDEWSPLHVTAIRKHKYGSLFWEPAGFIQIQQAVNGLTSLDINNSDDDKMDT